jgi:ribonuclease HI
VRRLAIVGVIGSGTHAHEDLAAPLGAWLATQPVHVLTGGGAGVMETVSRAFASMPNRRGIVLGVLPASDATSGDSPAGYPNPWVELPIRTHLPLRGERGSEPLSRNHVNVLTADLLIVLPGGAGTASEIELALRYGRPVLGLADRADDIPEQAAGIRIASSVAELTPLIEAALAHIFRQNSPPADTMPTPNAGERSSPLREAARSAATTAAPTPHDNGTQEAQQPGVSKTQEPEVTIYTDGACRGNPGPGGWGVVLVTGEHRRTLHGGEAHTTNNRMELMAAIRGLDALARRCRVALVTDSEYVKNGITSWLRSWRARGWKTAAGAPVKNRDLWEELDAAARKHDVTWRWVRGHTGNPGNEEADRLARRGIDELA